MAQMIMKKWKYPNFSPLQLLDKVSEVVSHVRHTQPWYGSIHYLNQKTMLRKCISKYLIFGLSMPNLQEDIENILLDALEVDPGLQQALLHG